MSTSLDFDESIFGPLHRGAGHGGKEERGRKRKKRDEQVREKEKHSTTTALPAISSETMQYESILAAKQVRVEKPAGDCGSFCSANGGLGSKGRSTFEVMMASLEKTSREEGRCDVTMDRIVARKAEGEVKECVKG